MKDARNMNDELLLLERIQDGLLHLTMDDLQDGVTFEEARLGHIKGGYQPGHRAFNVILTSEDRMRVLKNRFGERT